MTASRSSTIHRYNSLLFAFSLSVQAAAGSNRGGELQFALRSEPKTLNPLYASEMSSHAIVSLLHADLIHIDSLTQRSEGVLALTWKVSPDRRRYSLRLRPDLRFSDGHPCTVDDVLFTFQVLLDEKTHSPQRDFLMPRGKAPRISRTSSEEVSFDFPEPYAAAERLFGGIYILPKHRLEKSFREGSLEKAWALTVAPETVAGMGPFRLQSVRMGQEIILERNPYYWKKDSAGRTLPYLDQLHAALVPSADAEALRFANGELDVIDHVSGANFEVLERQATSRGFQLQDAGASLEWTFLLLNQNNGKSDPMRDCFRDDAFRRAVSMAIDRSAMVKVAHQGRAEPLANFVTPADRLWFHGPRIAPTPQISQARGALQKAGYHWAGDQLYTPKGQVVEFSLAYSASSRPNAAVANLIMHNLASLGIKLRPVSLEFHSLLDRVFRSFDYQAAIMALAEGDTDPNSELNVLTSGGGTHVWNLGESTPATAWQREVNELMARQMTAANYPERKRLFDRVQDVMADHLPLIPLLSPHVLAGAQRRVGDFKPAVLGEHVLWNADELYVRPGSQ